MIDLLITFPPVIGSFWLATCLFDEKCRNDLYLFRENA